MDAVKFVEERRRMCKSFGDKCTRCPALKVHENELYCAVDIRSTLDDTAQVAIVEGWSAAHPRRTRQSVFLEQYPEAYVAKSTGLSDIQPCFIDKTLNPRGCVKKCVDCKREFWMQEVE